MKGLVLQPGLEQWLKEQVSKPLLSANEKDLRRWLFAQPATAVTRNHYRQAAVAFWAFLVDYEYVDRNVAYDLPRVPQPEPLPKALTTAEGRAIDRAVRLFPRMIQVLVVVLLYQGLRKSEAINLEWRHVDLSDGWIRFMGKGRKERGLPITPRALRLLSAWRDECPDPRWARD